MGGGEDPPAGAAPMHWWVLIPMAAAAVLLVGGLYRWASGDPGVDAERAREQFSAEQDWRGLRRAGGEVTQAAAAKK